MNISEACSTEEDDALTRRTFVGGVSLAGTATLLAPELSAQSRAGVDIALLVNGREHRLTIDPNVTLLDALRERLQLTGTKKGCDHGQCGACTVLIEGKPANACLTLAIMCQGDKITTIEGLAQDDRLHPVQAAFIEHDGLQCGYCTPGQICSAVAVIEDLKRDTVSNATLDVRKRGPVQVTDDEIRERMSGNICRCAAYPNIVVAVRAVHEAGRA